MDFLRGQSRKTRDALQDLDARMADRKDKKEAESVKLAAMDQRVEEIREVFVRMGEKTKAEIVDSARIQASQMIEKATAEAGYRMARAKKAFWIRMRR